MKILPGSDLFYKIAMEVERSKTFNFHDLIGRFFVGTFEMVHIKNTLVSLSIINNDGVLLKQMHEIDSTLSKYRDDHDTSIDKKVFDELVSIVERFKKFMSLLFQNAKSIPFLDKKDLAIDLLSFDIFYLTIYNENSAYDKVQKAMGYHLLRSLSLIPEIYFPLDSANKINRLASLPTFETKFNELMAVNSSQVKQRRHIIKENLAIKNNVELLFGRIMLLCPEHIYVEYFSILLQYSKLIFLLDKVMSPMEYNFTQDLISPKLETSDS